MTEKEYIFVCDLRSVRIIRAVLRDIVSENNSQIPNEEYGQIARTLFEWEQRLTAVVSALTE